MVRESGERRVEIDRASDDKFISHRAPLDRCGWCSRTSRDAIVSRSHMLHPQPLVWLCSKGCRSPRIPSPPAIPPISARLGPDPAAADAVPARSPDRPPAVARARNYYSSGCLSQLLFSLNCFNTLHFPQIRVCRCRVHFRISIPGCEFVVFHQFVSLFFFFLCTSRHSTPFFAREFFCCFLTEQ